VKDSNPTPNTTKCHRCGGAGRLRIDEPESNGGQISAVCDRCGGSGRTSQTTEAAGLARLLDKFGSDLANDLEWALSWMDLNAARLGNSIQDARRYADARTHLKARRLFEKVSNDGQP
jgi:hypothetical protein